MVYELMLIAKPMLAEDIKTNVLSKIEKSIKQLKGKVLEIDVWGKRHLAYPIEKYDEGYYVIYTIDLDPGNTSEFDHQIKHTNGMLRFLRIQKDNL